MTRILERSETGPLRIAKAEIADDAIFVCRCGLSQSQPFCDGSHKMTRDEPTGPLVRYEQAGPGPRVRRPVRVVPAEPVPATPPTP